MIFTRSSTARARAAADGAHGDEHVRRRAAHGLIKYARDARATCRTSTRSPRASPRSASRTPRRERRRTNEDVRLHLCEGSRSSRASCPTRRAAGRVRARDPRARARRARRSVGRREPRACERRSALLAALGITVDAAGAAPGVCGSERRHRGRRRARALAQPRTTARDQLNLLFSIGRRLVAADLAVRRRRRPPPPAAAAPAAARAGRARARARRGRARDGRGARRRGARERAPPQAHASLAALEAARRRPRSSRCGRTTRRAPLVTSLHAV